MIEAARQREVALGFVSDLLATVAIQNGHIEAMAKHTNRLTQHSEMCCQDLHEQVRILTEKLATEDDRGPREADGFRVLKDQFIQNAADLERVRSERDRLHRENQDLRESLEVKRESSPRGGSGKSAKIPDPERLDNGVSPKYKAWKGDMVGKLAINEYWYVTDAARVAYCLSRLTGQARDHVKAARGCDGNAAFGSYTDIFAVLDQIYIDPDEKNTAREKLRELQLTNEGLAAFRSAFYSLAQTSGEPRETWKDSFYRKLPKQWQKTLADNHANEAYTVEDIMRSAARQYSLSNGNGTGHMPGKGTDSQVAKKGKLYLGNSQSTRAEPNAGERVFSPEYQMRKEEGACYGCGRKDHIARFCPKKRAGVNAVKQISDTREVGELSDSDSGNEEA
ncbi:hypothetical protein E4U25_006381 [Claviceps purpurea]|nr:hypothetical protein E4U25_006381 [Claviceps purpurea]